MSNRFRRMSTSTGSRFITGIGSLKHDGRDRMLILLDIEALVGSVKMVNGAQRELARA